MTRVTIRVNHCDGDPGVPAAWLIPGGDPSGWVNSLCHFSDPGSIGLVVIPPPTAGSPGGLLVLASRRLDGAARGPELPLALRAGALYLPLESRLSLPVTDGELLDLLGGQKALLHPVHGFVVFGPGSVRSMADLIQPPVRKTSVWMGARPGEPTLGRLLSVEAADPPTMESALAEGGDGIGDLSPTDLMEPEGPMGDLAEGLRATMAGTVSWLTSMAGGGSRSGPDAGGRKPAGRGPPTGPGPADSSYGASSFLDKVAAWADRALRGLDPAVRARRSRALEKLVEMLRSNPDEGLRHAIGLAGLGGGRGLANPAGSLSSHGTDFDLADLGGGRATDAWTARPDLRDQLSQEYRRLASRALALGQYRRAAYIYAHLLGELDAAARALQQGKHFREAAAVLRDHLHRPLDAARCLVEGGLITEAIPIYEQHQDFLEVARLQERLGRLDLATAALRRAVDLRLEAGDLLGAAGLLETRLRCPDEALKVLDRGWPSTPQAGRCLKEAFALLGRLGRHDVALRRLEALEWPSTASRNPGPAVVAEILSRLAHDYPDRDVQSLAQDVGRVVIGRVLGTPSEGGGATPSEVGGLVRHVVHVGSTDELLGRDLARFLELSHRRVSAPPSRGSDPVCLAIRVLPHAAQLHFRGVVETLDEFFVVGYRPYRELVVLRAPWSSPAATAAERGAVVLRGTAQPPAAQPLADIQMVRWEGRLDGETSPLICPPRRGVDSLLAWVPGEQPLESRSFPSSDLMPERIVTGTPPWLPGKAVGLCRDESGVSWVILPEDGGHGVVQRYSARGQILGSERIDGPKVMISTNLLPRKKVPDAVREPITPACPVAVHDGHFFVAVGTKVLHVAPGGRTRETELLGPARSLLVAAPFTRGRVVVGLDRGGMLMWSGVEPRPRPASFADDMESPKVTLTRDGLLVAATAGMIRVWDTDRGQLKLLGEVAGPGSAPFALAATWRVRQFAVFTVDGRLSIYRVP